MRRKTCRCLLTLGAALLAAGSLTSAQERTYSNLPEKPEMGMVPQFGSTLPLESEWLDTKDALLPLAALFDGDLPVLIVGGYSRCTMLCSPALQSVAAALEDSALVAGKDYKFIFFSIDPEESRATAAEVRRKFVSALDSAAYASDAVHFLRTKDADTISAMTEAIGMYYSYVEATGEYAHPASIVVVTADGRVADYLGAIGVDAHRIESALRDLQQTSASQRKEVPVLLGCFHYDPETGRYTIVAERLLQTAGAATLLLLVGFLLLQRKRKAQR